ncbi:MAG: hypothetical protein WC868_02415 [Bacteroidales bacterium]
MKFFNSDIFLISTILFLSSNIIAQEKSNISLEISKTVKIQSFFDRYRFDGGTSYNLKISNYYIGGSLNITYSKLYYEPNLTYGDYGNDTKTFIIKPRINIAYPIKLSAKVYFVPKFGMGYSIIYMNSKKYDFTDYQYGSNTCLELKLNYITKTKMDYFFLINYDYIYLKKNENFTQLNYYRNVHLLNFGIGAKLKFYKKDEKQ